jgi:sugar transferase (PEP-CTERM/EpsH1 system associated)
MKILYLAARFPQPPFKGDQMRAFHQLRLLSPRHRITLLSLAEEEVAPSALERVRNYCTDVILVPHTRSRAFLNLTLAPFSHYPLQTLLRRSRTFQRVLNRLLCEHDFDLAHVQLVRMAPYLERAKLPRVIDLIDALSLNMQRRYSSETPLLRLPVYWEWQRLRRYEPQVCRNYDRVTVVSETDRSAIGDFPNIHINPNGVDLSVGDLVPQSRPLPNLLFVGTMDYYPNIQAVCFFVKDILPLIKAQVPGVTFTIVGPNPTRAVSQLSSDPAVTVTGFVPDLMVYFNRSAVVVCPMRAGSGMQFKVIEAMSHRLPVVATSFALGGVAVKADVHLLVADDPVLFAQHVVSLLRNPELAGRLSTAGRLLVEEKYGWERTVTMLEEVYDVALRQRG